MYLIKNSINLIFANLKKYKLNHLKYLSLYFRNAEPAIRLGRHSSKRNG